MQEHSVINFTTATTCDTITIHSGKEFTSPLSQLSALLSPTKHLTFVFWPLCWKINETVCCYSAASSPRKLYDTRDGGHSSVTQIDFDDDKYRRRPALSWFAQILKLVSWTGALLFGTRNNLLWILLWSPDWKINKYIFYYIFINFYYIFINLFRNRTGGKRTSLTWKQRVFMLLLVGVLGFFTLIIIMAKLGRASAGSDPNLDPLLNPNIRVGKNWWQALIPSSLSVLHNISLCRTRWNGTFQYMVSPVESAIYPARMGEWCCTSLEWRQSPAPFINIRH